MGEKKGGGGGSIYVTLTLSQVLDITQQTLGSDKGPTLKVPPILPYFRKK